MDLIFLLIIYIGLGVKKQIIYLLLISYTLSCCAPFKQYRFNLDYKIKRIKGEKEFPSFLSVGQRACVKKIREFYLPENVCEKSDTAELMAYAKKIYRKLNHKGHSKIYESDFSVVREDSVIYFKFKNPKHIHANESYWYEKKKCAIIYMYYSSGKF